MGKFINFIIANLLQPCFGKYWLEITGWLMLILFALIIIFCLVLLLKYNRLVYDLNSLKDFNKAYEERNKELVSEKKDLELSLKYIKEKLEEEKESNISLIYKNEKESKKFKELEALITEKNSQIDELTKKIKRSESAKKAAETRKKNKEKKAENI